MALIQKKIERKPLVLYLTGKLASYLTPSLLDSVRNVIERGEVFGSKHLITLESTLDDIDANKPEVKDFVGLVRGFLSQGYDE